MDTRDYSKFSMQHYIDLVFQKAKAGLRVEASRGYLGFLWWMIEPLIYMSVFYIISGHLFNRGDDKFIFFLLTGLIVWKWFASSVNAAAISLAPNIGLMNQVYLPKIIFPLIAISINTFKFIIILLLFLIFILFMSVRPSAEWLFLPFLLFTQFLLILSISTFLAAIMPFFPDLRHILDNLLLLLFFISGIFFEINRMPESIRRYLWLNPMAQLITMYRKLLLNAESPNFGQLFCILLFSIIILIIAVGLFRIFDRVYPKILY